MMGVVRARSERRLHCLLAFGSVRNLYITSAFGFPTSQIIDKHTRLGIDHLKRVAQMKVVGPSEVYLDEYFAFLVDMAQNKECDDDNDNTQCDRFVRKYFPITKENAYGVIPILGAITSCFAVGITMQILCDTMRDMIWAGAWFCLGFLLFVSVQILWGFHAKKQKLLLLWLICKGVETLVSVAGIAYSCLGGPWASGLFAPSLIILIVLVVLLHVGYGKYKALTPPPHNIIADLDKIVTK